MPSKLVLGMREKGVRRQSGERDKGILEGEMKEKQKKNKECVKRRKRENKVSKSINLVFGEMKKKVTRHHA